MKDDPNKEYTYETYQESGEVKPSPEIVAPEDDLNSTPKEYMAGFSGEEFQNLPDYPSLGENLNDA